MSLTYTGDHSVTITTMFSPLIPKLEILDVLTLFSIIPDFTVMPF